MPWTEEQIKTVLSSPFGKTGNCPNKKIIWRMLQELAKRQEPDELSAQRTFHSNARGFNAYDAELLTDIAKSSLPYGNLTDKQVKLVATRLKKYAKQLSAISEVTGKSCPITSPPVQPLTAVISTSRI